MNILVVGCGHVGAALVRDLENAGHDISLIEKQSENLKRLDGFDDYSFGGTAFVGDGTDPDVLRRGGIESCDAVAAVSGDDSENLMTAQIAKKLFGKKRVLCRVSDPNLESIYREKFGIETICPTVLTVRAVFDGLERKC